MTNDPISTLDDALDGTNDENSGETPPWEQPAGSEASPEAGTEETGHTPEDYAEMDMAELPTGESPPPIYRATQVKEDFGVEGEEYSFLVVLLTVAGGGGAVCLHGLSRSGKDWLMDAVEACLPEHHMAEIPDSSTESSLFRQAPQFNRANAHRHQDIVNLDDHIEDVLKKTGEGASISRTISVQDDEGDYQPMEMVIEPPGALVWMLASDNEQVDLNDYPELRNRSLVVSTDASQMLSEQIQKRQSRNRGLAYDRNLNNVQIQDLQSHIASIPVNQWEYGNDDNPDFYHPYYEAFADQHPIPTNFVESRMDSDRLWDFVEIISVWNHTNRLKVEVEYHDYEKMRMVTTPKDLWLAMRVYGEKLIMSALSLSELDRRIMWYLRENKQPHTVSALAQIVRQAGYIVTPRDVRRSCENMVNKNYLTKDDSNGVEYQASPFASEVQEYNTLDWTSIIDDAAEDVYRVLPDPLADLYVENFCSRPVKATHPVTGEVVDIEEFTAFEEQIKEREADLEKMLDNPLYETPSASDSGSSSGTTAAADGGTEDRSGQMKFGG